MRLLEELDHAAFAHLAPGGALWLVVVSNVRAVFERPLTRAGSRPELVARGRQHAVLRAASPRAGSEPRPRSQSIRDPTRTGWPDTGPSPQQAGPGDPPPGGG